MSGLNQEVWLADIYEDWEANDTFINESRDMSELVENDKINLAEAGVNPEVLRNNTTYPVPIAERGDVPYELPLERLDTTNTVVRNAEKAELKYDKMKSVNYGHKQAIRMYMMEDAAYNWTPDANGEYTPLIQCSGDDAGDGTRMMLFEDVLDLETAFNEAEIPEEGRILVLNAKHKGQLRKQDLKLYKEIFSGKEKEYASFKFYTLASKRMPLRNRNTGAKYPFRAQADADSALSSIAYHKDEVMRARGTADMFERLKDPEARGDIIGYQQRFLSLPIRGKAVGGIYSPAI